MRLNAQTVDLVMKRYEEKVSESWVMDSDGLVDLILETYGNSLKIMSIC